MTTYTAPPTQTHLVLNGGDTLNVEVDGLAYGTLINQGAVLNVGSGGTDIGTTNNGGNEYVFGTSIDMTINFGGLVFVEAGATIGTTINAGGTEYDQGGASIGTTINSGGSQYVQNGSTATNATIDGAFAIQYVDGGTSIATTIKAGGLEWVRNGGTANNTIIQDGGVEHVFSSGTANTVIFAGSDSLLQLDNPSGLTGTIIDWNVGDKIDFLNTMVTGVNETGNTLTVTYGDHQTASYSLAGKQANAHFALQDDGQGGTNLTLALSTLSSLAAIQNAHLAITRTSLASDQAKNILGAIEAGTQTEAQYLSGLLSQASSTTIPAVAVEATMYGALGTAAEVTSLVTQFLPGQVAFAMQHGFDPEVYASEAMGLAFAFSDETGGTAFADAYGPSNAAMQNTKAGDIAFATAAATAIFGSASSTNLVDALVTWVSNWKAFYGSHGIPGIANPTSEQVDLAARGTAWGDAVGVALDNNLGPLKALTTNFLFDAAEGIASYSMSLVSQPAHHLGDATNSSSAHLLSLAGGGIKAMTADAGLFAGLLQHFGSEGASTTIGNLLSKVSAVSANSGSSWFADLLAYSPAFENSLQNYTDFFSSDGYMGQLKTAYYNYANLPSNGVNQYIVEFLSDFDDLAGMNLGQLYSLLANSSSNWNDFLSNVIFEPDNTAQLLQSVNFHSDHSLRTNSLASQSLVFQSSISSNDAAINKYSIFPPNETVSTITNAGNDSSGHSYIFIPAIITSLGSETDVSAPALPSIFTGSLDVTYSTYNTPLQPPFATTVLPNFNFDGLSAFLATSASSAALSAVASGGFYDSEGALLSTLLNEVQNISPLVQVNNASGTSTALDPAPLNFFTTPAFLVEQGNSLLRLADGAYIDNTSVTSGLTYLQANNHLSNFTVTALTYFDGVDISLEHINPGYKNIGQEAAVLFTGSNQNQTDLGFNLSHPSAAVFESTATTGLDKPIWEYIGPAGFKLDYFQLGVTTATNKMGIAQGEHGTLDLWIITTTAGALPSLDQTTWSQYSDLYDQIRDGLQTAYNGHVGADLLASSLGLGVQLTGVAPHLDHAII